MSEDQGIQERMAKRGMEVPAELGPLKDARWVASSDDWYIETEEGRVYYWDGKEWRFCPQGAMR